MHRLYSVRWEEEHELYVKIWKMLLLAYLKSTILIINHIYIFVMYLTLLSTAQITLTPNNGNFINDEL